MACAVACCACVVSRVCRAADASCVQLLKQVALLPPENALVEVHPDPQHRYLTSLVRLSFFPG